MIRALRALAFPACAVLIIGWIAGGQYALGQDYNPWGVFPSVFYRYCLAHGIFPTWFSAWAGGFPLAGIPAYHVFHLPAWLLSRIPGFASGGALLVTAAYHVSLFACLHWLLTSTFRRFLKIDFGYSFVLAMPLVYNQRVLDAVRYGSYFEATAFYYGFVFLSYAFLRERRLSQLLGVAFFAHCFFTSGYPPMEIYGGLGFFVTFLVILATRLGTEELSKLVLAFSQIAAAIFTAMLLAAPQWMGGLEFSRVNAARVHDATLESSSVSSMTVHDFVSTLFRPWGADVHSAFSGSTLLAVLILGVLLYLALAVMREIRNSGKATRFLFILAALLFLVLYSFGPATPFFTFVHDSVPLFAWVRSPARVMSIFFPLLAIAVLELRPQDHWREVKTALRAVCLFVGGILGLVAFIEGFWPRLAQHWDSQAYPPKMLDAYWILPSRIYWIFLGLMTCASLWALLSKPRKDALWALGTAVVLQAYLIFHFGMFTTDQLGTWSFATLDRAEHLPLYSTVFWPSNTDDGGYATTDYKTLYKTAGKNRSCYLPIDHPPQLDDAAGPTTGLLLPYYLTRSVSCRETREQILNSLRETNCGNSGVAPTLLQARDCPGWQEGATPRSFEDLNRANRLTALSTNGFTLESRTAAGSILVTPYSWADQAWKSWIDGQPSAIVQVNGGFVGLNVPAGNHRLSVFHFSKGYQKGLWIALFTAVALLLALALGLLFRPRFFLPLSWAGLFLVGSSLVGLYAWEIHGYPENAWKPVLMNNSYSELLQKQLAIWKAVGR